MWKTTKVTTHRLQIFVDKCLRSILNINWFDKVRNEELWKTQGKKEWSCKFYAANGVGSVTHCVNQKIMSQDKH